MHAQQDFVRTRRGAVADQAFQQLRHRHRGRHRREGDHGRLHFSQRGRVAFVRQPAALLGRVHLGGGAGAIHSAAADETGGAGRQDGDAPVDPCQMAPGDAAEQDPHVDHRRQIIGAQA